VGEGENVMWRAGKLVEENAEGGKYGEFPEHLGEEPAGCRPKTI